MIKPYQNIHGKMYTGLVQQLLERLESLEHLSNQHDILLTGLMTSIIMKQSSKPDTSIGTVKEST